MRRLIDNVDELYTCDANDRVLRKAWLIAEDGRIAALGEGPAPAGEFDERLDLSGSIGMPGLVNTHHHFFQTLTRAIPRAQRAYLIDWLGLMYPVWGSMTPDDLGAAAAATAAELLLTGATTSADHFYCIPKCDPDFVDTEVRVARDAGLRLHLVRGSLTSIESDLEARLSEKLGPKAGGFIDAPAAVLDDMRRTIARHHDAGSGSMTTIALGPTTPTYDDLGYLRAVSDLARESEVGLHMHLHPQPFERDRVRERFGITPLQILDRVGYLGPRTWLAHCTRFDGDDMDLMADRGAAVSHCPRMILRLGARITRLHEMRARGVRVAVGVDGAASNDGGSMLGEMRLVLLLHRLVGGGNEVDPDEWLDPYDVLLMSTREAAATIGRHDIGRLEPGLCADVTAFDMRTVDFAGARTDLLSGLLLAGDDSRASLTMTGGCPRVRHGKLLAGDEQSIRAKVDASTERLMARAAAALDVNYRAFAERGARRNRASGSPVIADTPLTGRA